MAVSDIDRGEAEARLAAAREALEGATEGVDQRAAEAEIATAEAMLAAASG